jgi:hypothetical protein
VRVTANNEELEVLKEKSPPKMASSPPKVPAGDSGKHGGRPGKIAEAREAEEHSPESKGAGVKKGQRLPRMS